MASNIIQDELPRTDKNSFPQTDLERFNRSQTLKREITTNDLVHFEVK
jgi:hypothetical protein